MLTILPWSLLVRRGVLFCFVCVFWSSITTFLVLFLFDEGMIFKARAQRSCERASLTTRPIAYSLYVLFSSVLQFQKLSATIKTENLSYGSRVTFLLLILLSNLNPSIDCCSWEGITCDDSSNSHITAISLSFKGLHGELPLSVLKLHHLSQLNLSHNHLSGPLPPDLLSSLGQLTVLDLSYNRFNGELPLER